MSPHPRRPLPVSPDPCPPTSPQHTRDSITGEQLVEGFRPELVDPTKGGGVAGRGIPGLVWHALDVRYDQCVGSGAWGLAVRPPSSVFLAHSCVCPLMPATAPAVCECFGVRGRDIPDLSFSMHFSCMQVSGARGGDASGE